VTILLALYFAALAVILAANAVYLRRRRPSGALTGDPPMVSVLIPARDEAAGLRRLLPTLLNQDYPRFEVVIYDDASDDATPSVLDAVRDPRLRCLRGAGPPPGWVGKVHALYQATREARGDLFLFLDADVALVSAASLTRLVAMHRALPAAAVLTGFGRFRGGGLALVSLVPFVILSYVPHALAPRIRWRHVAGMSGACWMITRELYRRFEPHLAHKGEVLEDIRIGQFLHLRGVTPRLHDLQPELEVWMYGGLGDAWRGFRRNVYLFMGGKPVQFAVSWTLYVVPFVLAPLVSPWFLAVWYAVKLLGDRITRFPLWVTALTPAIFVLGSVQQLDSAVAHWRGRVTWKGREVGTRRVRQTAGTT
jgi:glycosyltransferase involved in cell wall biosynthesis